MWVSECCLTPTQQFFTYIMATIFSGGRSRRTRREPPMMGKQLVNFITCGCESSAPFYSHYKTLNHDPRVIHIITSGNIWCVEEIHWWYSVDMSIFVTALTWFIRYICYWNWEPPMMGKQLVNFITCGCESSAPFFVIDKAGRELMPHWW
jgi:hypothetical protein